MRPAGCAGLFGQLIAFCWHRGVLRPSFRCQRLAAGGAGNRADMIRLISDIPLAPDPICTEASPLFVTKTLFLAPAVDDGALIALVLCDNRAFRVTRGGSSVTAAMADLDDAIAIFRHAVRGR